MHGKIPRGRPKRLRGAAGVQITHACSEDAPEKVEAAVSPNVSRAARPAAGELPSAAPARSLGRMCGKSYASRKRR